MSFKRAKNKLRNLSYHEQPNDATVESSEHKRNTSKSVGGSSVIGQFGVPSGLEDEFEDPDELEERRHSFTFMNIHSPRIPPASGKGSFPL